MAFFLVGLHLRDPARLVGRGEGRGDYGEGAVLADFGGHGIHHRLGDAVELGLVDEPLPRIRLGVGVVADDVDAGGQRLLQHRRDRHRVVGGEQDAVHAAGDVVVDQRDLVVDIGLARTVGLGIHVAHLLGGIGDALGGGVEIADADQLRHVDHFQGLALAVGGVGGHAAVIGLGCGGRGRGVAGQRIGRQVVAARPGRSGKAQAGRERQRHERRENYPTHFFLHYRAVTSERQ